MQKNSFDLLLHHHESLNLSLKSIGHFAVRKSSFCGFSHGSMSPINGSIVKHEEGKDLSSSSSVDGSWMRNTLKERVGQTSKVLDFRDSRDGSKGDIYN